MYSKILVLAFVACCQVATAQRPTVLPNILGTGIPPSFPSAFNTNWVRPYYTAAAEGWRTYFEQIERARNQLYQTLANIPNATQNVDLRPPVLDIPVPTVVPRPQVQGDVPVRPQVQVAQVPQGQTTGRPQPAVAQTVSSGTRPIASTVSSVVPVVPQVVPQVNPQVPTWVGK